VHPGYAVSDIRENTGFDFDCPANVPDTQAPSAAEQALLRGVVATKIAENYPAFARRVWQN
jgi:glutaconate CoA-transferase subunit B